MSFLRFSRKPSAFTLLEILLSTTILVLLMAGLTSITVMSIKRGIRASRGEFFEQQSYRLCSEIKDSIKNSAEITIYDSYNSTNATTNGGQKIKILLRPPPTAGTNQPDGGNIIFSAIPINPNDPNTLFALKVDRTPYGGSSLSYTYLENALPLRSDNSFFRYTDYDFIEFLWGVRFFRYGSTNTLIDLPIQGVASPL